LASTTTALKTGYAPVSGLKLYYEIHGAGEPLIVLHGGLSERNARRDFVVAVEPPAVIAVDC
jgi:pimeloyl-ACP methyl ester carboxylesterase